MKRTASSPDKSNATKKRTIDVEETATRCLEDELTHAFQLMGLDASSFIETLRNKPTDFLADERPCVQRLAQLYHTLVPPPAYDEDRIARLEIMGEQVMSRFEIMGEHLSRPRFATRILADEGDTSETTTLPRFVSHSLRCGNHYITTMREVALNMPPNPVVALLLPPLSKCISGAEIRISCHTTIKDLQTPNRSIDSRSCVVPATGDMVHPLISTPHNATACLRIAPTVGFLTFVAVPELSTWMMEGSVCKFVEDSGWVSSGTVDQGCLELTSFGKGRLRTIFRNETYEFFLSKTQSENWPVSWELEF